MKVVKLTKIPTEPVYDITVEPGNNYILSNGVICHNSGGVYAASNVITMSKRKVVEGKSKIGNIVTCTNTKGRLTKEGAKAEIFISFAKGLSRYHGLVEAATAAGIWPRTGNRVEIQGKKVWPKEIYKNPELYFDKEVLDGVDKYLGSLYNYGVSSLDEVDDIYPEEENEVETE